MAKVVICLVMTCIFSFMGYNSFMTNDYKPLQQWLIYYKEYKELQGALDKGNIKKAELLEKLKILYPEKAKEIEDMARRQYIDLSNEAKSVEENVTNRRNSEERETRTETPRTQAPATQQKQSKNTDTRQNNSTSTSTNNNTNTANSKSK
jgi:hypothetical protein